MRGPSDTRTQRNAEWEEIGRGQGQASYWRERKFFEFLLPRILGPQLGPLHCV
jgi:hypothetical protein